MGALRQDGAVLLVSLYELGHQPQGLAGPLGFLRAAGFAPAALDLAAEAFDAGRVRRARAIWVSVPMHTALRLGVRFLQRAREENPEAAIGLFGHYAWLNAAYLHQQGAGVVLAGECEEALLQLCQALDEGQDLAAAQRLIGGPVLQRLAFVPPSREGLLPLSRYARFDPGDGSAPRVAGHAEASRGCKYRCRHCPLPAVYRGRFFVVPQDVVLADVAQQVAAGAEHITFGDPDFLNGPRHALEVARALHRRFPALTFDVTVKVEHVVKHPHIWPELRDLGCRFVVSAVESLSPRVLEVLDKGHTPADVRTALHTLRAAGLRMRPSLVPFTPWSTLDDYLALFDFIAEEELAGDVDPVQLAIRLLIPPGSLLLDLPELRPHLSALSPADFAHPWTHPDPRMDRLQEQAAARVAEGVAREEDPVETLQALHGLALSAAGRSGERGAIRPATASRAPRLTEPWFC